MEVSHIVKLLSKYWASFRNGPGKRLTSATQTMLHKTLVQGRSQKGLGFGHHSLCNFWLPRPGP